MDLANLIFYEIIHVIHQNQLTSKSYKNNQKSWEKVDRSPENSRLQIEPPPEDKELSLKCKHYFTFLEEGVRNRGEQGFSWGPLEPFGSDKQKR